jgi:hypothetical protein
VVITAMAEALDARLANGVDEWTAVCESLLEFIARFDRAADGAAARTHRIDLWTREPALRVHYLHYVAQAEQAVLDSLCRYRRTEPETDDRAQLIAVATIGAYRATVTTHGRTRDAGQLTEHLRESLAVLAGGLAPQPSC